MRFPYATLCVWLVNFRVRLPYEIVCFLLHNFLTRFPNEISCFLAVMMRCPYGDICRVLLHTFLMRFRAFWPLWDVCRCVSFLRHRFRTRYPDEISCLFGPLRVLRNRLHACLVVMRCLDEMSSFLAAEFSFWWCDARTVERWILKDAGDWAYYAMVYWTLRGFVCASWVVRMAGDECKLGGGGGGGG